MSGDRGTEEEKVVNSNQRNKVNKSVNKRWKIRGITASDRDGRRGRR